MLHVGGGIAHLKAELEIELTELQALFLHSINQTAGEMNRLEQKIPPWIGVCFVECATTSTREFREFATRVDASGVGRLGGGGGGSGSRLRVPDPSGWSMTTLKDRGDVFKGRRVGSIWLWTTSGLGITFTLNLCDDRSVMLWAS